MKMNRSLHFGSAVIYALSTCILICFCSGNLTDGNSSETTNVAVVTDHNEPAAFAKIKLVDATNWAYLIANHISPIVDSAITDEYGIFSFANIPQTECNLQIDHEESGIVLRNFSRDGKINYMPDTIGLQVFSSLDGSVDNANAVSMMLEGTAYNTTISPDQTFSIELVAPGNYPILIESNTGILDISYNPVTFLPDRHLTVNNLTVAFDRLQIDDFEDGDTISIPGLLTGGYWYSAVDKIQGGSSEISQTIQPAGINGGNAIKTDVILIGRFEGAWAITGVNIGKMGSIWDLSEISGISFQAKGNGTIRISINSALVDSIDTWPHYGYTFTLDTNWTSFKIPVDSLELSSLYDISKAYDAGITWNDASKQITCIQFEASSMYHNLAVENINMTIDNLCIEGISASDIMNQMEKK